MDNPAQPGAPAPEPTQRHCIQCLEPITNGQTYIIWPPQNLTRRGGIRVAYHADYCVPASIRSWVTINQAGA